jgi:hypothetical protein
MSLAAQLATLKADIKAAFLVAKTETDPSNFDAAMTTLANSIGDAINTYTTNAAISGVDAPAGNTHNALILS